MHMFKQKFCFKAVTEFVEADRDNEIVSLIDVTGAVAPKYGVTVRLVNATKS